MRLFESPEVLGKANSERFAGSVISALGHSLHAFRPDNPVKKQKDEFEMLPCLRNRTKSAPAESLVRTAWYNMSDFFLQFSENSPRCFPPNGKRKVCLVRNASSYSGLVFLQCSGAGVCMACQA